MQGDRKALHIKKLDKETNHRKCKTKINTPNPTYFLRTLSADRKALLYKSGKETDHRECITKIYTPNPTYFLRTLSAVVRRCPLTHGTKTFSYNA